MKGDSDPVDDPRRSILLRVRNNEITREEADAEARVLGYDSMECQPDPLEFDPLSSAFWTLPMALAWIIYRTRQPVRELIEEYRAASLVWRHRDRFTLKNGKPEKVFELLSPEPMTIFDVARGAAYVEDQSKLALPGAAARNELWSRLESSALIAEGIARGQTMHKPIRDAEWKTLAFQPDTLMPADAMAGWGENKPRYFQVIVRSADVIVLWPPLKRTDDSDMSTPYPAVPSSTTGDALPSGIPDRVLNSARRAELQRYAVVSQTPWEPPVSFSAELIALYSEPRIWLRDAVDFMTFGSVCDCTISQFRVAYERQRAAAPLFEAARRAELKLIGCPLGHGDDTKDIPPSYFDIPRTLGNADNSVEIVNDAIPDEDFYQGREHTYQSYQHVRVDNSSFKKWIEKLQAPLGRLVEDLPNDAANVDRIKPETTNDKKRAAVDSAIEILGIDSLAAFPQKIRERQIVGEVFDRTTLVVSDRYVRGRWSLALRNKGRT